MDVGQCNFKGDEVADEDTSDQEKDSFQHCCGRKDLVKIKKITTSKCIKPHFRRRDVYV